MTHPSIYARSTPNKIAYQMAGTGKAITYRELDELSNQGAHLFRSLGLTAGDHIAFLMENRLAFMEICWAAQRSGLYYTAISRYLTEEEIAYIVKDCGAKVFITTPQCAEKVKGLIKGEPGEPLFFMVDEPASGFRSWDKEAIAMPVTPVAPSIFSANLSGTGPAAILNQDGFTVNSLATPAGKGTVISIYATGEGQTEPGGIDGRIATGGSLPKPRQTVQVLIDGRKAEVQYAGAAPDQVAGLFQVNALIPMDASSGNVPIEIQMGNARSQPGMTVAVK